MGSFFLNLFVMLLIRQYFSLSPTARNLYTNSKKKNFYTKTTVLNSLPHQNKR